MFSCVIKSDVVSSTDRCNTGFKSISGRSVIIKTALESNVILSIYVVLVRLGRRLNVSFRGVFAGSGKVISSRRLRTSEATDNFVVFGRKIPSTPSSKLEMDEITLPLRNVRAV